MPRYRYDTYTLYTHLLERLLVDVQEHIPSDIVDCECIGMGAASIVCQPAGDHGVVPRLEPFEVRPSVQFFFARLGNTTAHA